MNFVPALGQFKAEFSGDHSAATVGWITGDSDLQSSLPVGRHSVPLHSMVSNRPGFSLFKSKRWGKRTRQGSGISAVPGSGRGRLSVVRIKEALNAILIFGSQAGEFNAHPKAGIFRAHHALGLDLLLVEPETDLENSFNGKRHNGFNVTAAPADVGSTGLHGCGTVFGAKLEGERQLVPGKAATLFLVLGGCLLFRVREFREPGAGLTFDKLDADLGFFDVAGIHVPDHAETSFLVCELHAYDFT